MVQDEDENKLSYLPIELWGRTGVFGRTARIKGDACLDSAATKYCISEDLSKKIGLLTDDIGRQEVEGANGQKFWYYARVKLTFSWTEEYRTVKERTWFCVVPDLFESIVLPNYFIHRRKEVLRLAQRRWVSKSYVAAMSFPWRSKAKKEADKQQADATRRKNKDKEERLVHDRQAELDHRYGISTTGTPPGPTPALSSSTTPHGSVSA